MGPRHGKPDHASADDETLDQFHLVLFALGGVLRWLGLRRARTILAFPNLVRSVEKSATNIRFQSVGSTVTGTRPHGGLALASTPVRRAQITEVIAIKLWLITSVRILCSSSRKLLQAGLTT